MQLGNCIKIVRTLFQMWFTILFIFTKLGHANMSNPFLLRLFWHARWEEAGWCDWCQHQENAGDVPHSFSDILLFFISAKFIVFFQSSSWMDKMNQRNEVITCTQKSQLDWESFEISQSHANCPILVNTANSMICGSRTITRLNSVLKISLWYVVKTRAYIQW